MSRFDALIDDVKTRTSASNMKKSNNNRRVKNDSSYRDQLDNTTMNVRPRTNNMTRPLNKIIAPTINITQEDEFPELSKTLTATQKEKNSSTWLETIRQQEENSQNENAINQYDPKYWDGATWIGPMLMRQEKYPTNWYVYMENAIKGNASSFLVPRRTTEYSRDGKNWYTSWDNTFTDEQLQQIREEEECNIRQEQSQILEEYSNTQLRNSARYYEETGELDDYAIARLQRLSYEKYTERFEQIEEEVYNDEELEEYDEYLEEDN